MRLPRRATHLLLYLCYLFVLAEGAAFLLYLLPMTSTQLFSHGSAFVRKMKGSAERYQRFLAARYDGLLGWDNPKAATRQIPACGSGMVTATYLEDRSRATPGAEDGDAILVFGDSFSHGNQVGDADSYPAQLSRLLRRKVINHGVGGYEPLQAMLKFEQRAADYRSATVAVLGIMNENVLRTVNSYRPVYVPHTPSMFGFKPYMRDGAFQPNPNGPEPAPFEEMRALARRAFREDYWALAEPSFPYSLALLDSLRRPSMRARLVEKLDYSRLFRLEDIRVNLERVLLRFAESARAHRMAPVVLFIPDATEHRGVFDELVAKLRARFGARVVFKAVRDERYRWAEYLSRADCHPSVTGYGIIAEHAAEAVREAEAQRS